MSVPAATGDACTGSGVIVDDQPLEDGYYHLFIRDDVLKDEDGHPIHWPITPEAVECLHQLADERWHAAGEELDKQYSLAQLQDIADAGRKINKLPLYLSPKEREGRKGFPKGNVALLPAIDWEDTDRFVSVRNPDPKHLGSRARLMPGQRVFFKLHYLSPGEADHACEVSWSSIYRRTQFKDTPIGRGPLTLGRHLALQDANLLPLGIRPGRQLHTAEWLLGAVDHEAKDEQSALAFASRIAVNMARPQGQARVLPLIPLKELSSPKPPSPALYIKRAKGDTRPFGKSDFIDRPEAFAFQGTKTYLHAMRTGPDTGTAAPLGPTGLPDQAKGLPPWQSGRKTDPPRDVSGLSDRQVCVSPIDAGQTFTFSIRFTNLSTSELELLCAALCPSDRFEHKIGMGRPIGLGSVKLDVESIELVDIGERYTTGMPCIRTAPDPANWPRRGMVKLRERHPDLHDALLQAGEPQRIQAPVHYPQRAGADIEDRNYQWFVDNDRSTQGRQMLAPLPTRPNTGQPGNRPRR